MSDNEVENGPDEIEVTDVGVAPMPEGVEDDADLIYDDANGQDFDDDDDGDDDGDDD
jgi:hypothetical protein